jgi:hypothetical protein
MILVSKQQVSVYLCVKTVNLLQYKDKNINRRLQVIKINIKTQDYFLNIIKRPKKPSIKQLIIILKDVTERRKTHRVSFNAHARVCTTRSWN